MKPLKQKKGQLINFDLWSTNLLWDNLTEVLRIISEGAKKKKKSPLGFPFKDF